MPHNMHTQADSDSRTKERRKRERARARRLGLNLHSRAMHESYEDLGYYLMLLIMNVCESLIKQVDKKTGIFNMYDSHKKTNHHKPYLSTHVAHTPHHAPKAKTALRPHK